MSADLQAVPDPPGSESSGRGGNGAGGNDARLRDIEHRLTCIETKFDTEVKHLATKAWVLGGVVGGMGLAVALAFTFLRLFGGVSE